VPATARRLSSAVEQRLCKAHVLVLPCGVPCRNLRNCSLFRLPRRGLRAASSPPVSCRPVAAVERPRSLASWTSTAVETGLHEVRSALRRVVDQTPDRTPTRGVAGMTHRVATRRGQSFHGSPSGQFELISSGRIELVVAPRGSHLARVPEQSRALRRGRWLRRRAECRTVRAGRPPRQAFRKMRTARAHPTGAGRAFYRLSNRPRTASSRLVSARP
jgi:hypothetical protein